MASMARKIKRSGDNMTNADVIVHILAVTTQ